MEMKKTKANKGREKKTAAALPSSPSADSINVIYTYTHLREREKNGTKSLWFMTGLCIEMAIILAAVSYT